MIKNYFFLVLFSISAACAMERTINPGIRYNILYKITSPKAAHWELVGHNDDNRRIGIIEYNRQEGSKWRITNFEVEPVFRNSKFRYGTAIFKRCLQEITKNSCTKITWTAYPLANAISLEQLNAIYRKIIDKIHPEIPGQLSMRDTVLGTDMTYIPA
jgi:hypothetical protein